MSSPMGIEDTSTALRFFGDKGFLNNLGDFLSVGRTIEVVDDVDDS